MSDLDDWKALDESVIDYLSLADAAFDAADGMKRGGKAWRRHEQQIEALERLGNRHMSVWRRLEHSGRALCYLEAAE